MPFAAFVFLARHRPKPTHGESPIAFVVLPEGATIAITKAGVTRPRFQDAELLLAGNFLGGLRRLDCRGGSNLGSL